MPNHEKISSRQLFHLVVYFIIGNVIWYEPSSAVFETKQDGWLASIIAVSAGLLLVMLYNAIYDKSSTETFVQFCNRVAGKWVGSAVSLLFLGFALTLCASVLRSLGNFIQTHILTATPLPFILISFMVIVVYGAHLGLETIARAGEIFFPWVIASFLLFFIILMPVIHYENIQPMFESDLPRLILGAIPVSVPFLESVLFMLLFFYVKRNGPVKKAFLLGSLSGGVIHIFVVALCVLVLGHELTARQAFPAFVLAKQILIGGTLERIEIPLSVIVFYIIYFKLVLSFSASAILFADTFRLKDYRTFLPPLAIIVAFYSMIMYPNFIYALRFIRDIYPYFAAVFGMLLPLILFAAAKLRDGRRN